MESLHGGTYIFYMETRTLGFLVFNVLVFLVFLVFHVGFLVFSTWRVIDVYQGGLVSHLTWVVFTPLSSGAFGSD